MLVLSVLVLLSSALANPFNQDTRGEQDAVSKPRQGFHKFEGDMVLSDGDIKKIDNGEGLSAGNARAATRYGRWPGGVVPFDVHSSVYLIIWKNNAIYSAMKEWSEKTCLKFKKRTNEKDYVRFVASSGCWSYVGKIGGMQDISIGFGCGSHGIALHEIGHALGFFHEQSRPDRDDYVEIVWDNISGGNENNFKKYNRRTIDSLDSPYDYDSIMHYEWNAFGRWLWSTTIKAKKPGVSFGQRSYLSTQDALQMNKMYSCKRT